jgi:hypothetical protein
VAASTCAGRRGPQTGRRRRAVDAAPPSGQSSRQPRPRPIAEPQLGGDAVVVVDQPADAVAAREAGAADARPVRRPRAGATNASSAPSAPRSCGAGAKSIAIGGSAPPPQRACAGPR